MYYYSYFFMCFFLSYFCGFAFIKELLFQLFLSLCVCDFRLLCIMIILNVLFFFCKMFTYTNFAYLYSLLQK